MKCENCGANLEINQEHRTKFCPYCGAAVQIPETAFDHEKFILEHNEQVRRQKVKEKNRNANIGIAICIGLIVFCLGGLMILSYFKP